MYTRTVAVVLLFLLAGSARASLVVIAWDQENGFGHSAELEAGGFAEVCGELEADERVSWTFKADAELGYLERVGSERIEEKRQERQDWFVLMGVNHLFAGLEAFVSANLFDFPGDLTARALPGGRTGYGLSLPMPR